MKGIQRITSESAQLRKEMQERTIGYLTAAFGLVAGLAWNDAIKSFIEHIFRLEKDTILAKFIYAFILTLVLVLVTSYLFRMFQKNTKTE